MCDFDKFPNMPPGTQCLLDRLEFQTVLDQFAHERKAARDLEAIAEARRAVNIWIERFFTFPVKNRSCLESKAFKQTVRHYADVLTSYQTGHAKITYQGVAEALSMVKDFVHEHAAAVYPNGRNERGSDINTEQAAQRRTIGELRESRAGIRRPRDAHNPFIADDRTIPESAADFVAWHGDPHYSGMPEPQGVTAASVRLAEETALALDRNTQQDPPPYGSRVRQWTLEDLPQDWFERNFSVIRQRVGFGPPVSKADFLAAKNDGSNGGLGPKTFLGFEVVFTDKLPPGVIAMGVATHDTEPPLSVVGPLPSSHSVIASCPMCGGGGGGCLGCAGTGKVLATVTRVDD